jgi:hypothetical protein
MSYSAQDILDAFKSIDPRVRFDLRNARGHGYECVLGPSQRGGRSCWVKIERYNGTVAFAAPLAQYMGASQRLNQPIHQHPLGYSAGPHYGRFDHALSPMHIRQRFPKSATDFVKLVLKGFQATGIPW